jgi:lipopolysaccharide export system permease protein
MSFPRWGIRLGCGAYSGGERTKVSRFDRYLLSQLLALFGFFSLVLVSVYWINRAVGLFDKLLGDGQTTLVFLQISLLMLPNVIRLVLPVSAFAAAVYVTNRLTQESELVVMQATGYSSFRLARPVIFFGLIVSLMSFVLMNVLVPMSVTVLNQRTAEISSDVTSRFLVDGNFAHPSNDMTLYIRDITPKGELLDLFLYDNRNANKGAIYLARRAFLVRSASGPKLLMFDGSIQRLDRQGAASLTLTRFSDFTYDLASLSSPQNGNRRALEELSTLDIIADEANAQRLSRRNIATIREELHGRLSQPLLPLGAALLGFSALLIGAYSRFGLWRQVLGAILLLVFIQLVSNWGSSQALKSPNAWPLTYLAPVCAIAISIGLLWQSQRPRRQRGAAAMTQAAAT